MYIDIPPSICEIEDKETYEYNSDISRHTASFLVFLHSERQQHRRGSNHGQQHASSTHQQ